MRLLRWFVFVSALAALGASAADKKIVLLAGSVGLSALAQAAA